MAFLIIFLACQLLQLQGYPSLVAAKSIQTSLSTNANNLTALNTITAPSWVSAPNSRGTSNILYSCLVTLFACIYTAIHLNVPKAHQSTARLVLDKVKWVAATLFAPEVVLYIALSQFLEAKQLAEDLRRYKVENPPTFDLKLGFFVVMGGLVVDIRDLSDDYKEVTLTTEGVRMLAEFERYFPPEVTQDTIQDKSKAGLIQKGLVIIQVGWMVIQCIARRAYGLPLTLLEVHTLVHVVCALIMYLFWIEKPLDIRLAATIDTERFRAFLALMVERTFYSEAPSTSGEDQEALEANISLNHDYETPGVRRLREAGSAQKKYPDAFRKGPGDNKFKDLLKVSIGNLDQAYSILDPEDHLRFFIDFDIWRTGLYLVLPIIYGGIHLTAWGFDFSISVERIVWRVCCIDIMATLICFPLLMFFFFSCVEGVKRLISSLPGETKVVCDLLDNVVKVFMGLLFYVTMFSYALSRVFIVVESFISLRHVPIGVYASPAWIQMLPHL